MGNTRFKCGDIVSDTVHPHACGEHLTKRYKYSHDNGSSPRLWGTPLWLVTPRNCSRFIPTPVGNTPRRPQGPGDLPVHPHACGEHSKNNIQDGISNGSSPRLWGTLLPAMHNNHTLRFIPTPVGNTPFARSSCAATAVHPHACGEH